MSVCIVVGTRPNFVKAAPIVHELERKSIPFFLIHTGQHYDDNMSGAICDDLELPVPDIELRVGSGTHAGQTAAIMTGLEAAWERRRPDVVVVVGDVNSTLAAALVAAKLQVPVAHVEAGLRSFDRTMPEEINRVLTDHVSEMLFTTEESARENLRREGVSEHRVHFVGNCMIDSLEKHKSEALMRMPWRRHGVGPATYALVTLHRPSNVDSQEKLGHLVALVNDLSELLPVIFPVHPRTQSRLYDYETPLKPHVHICEPLPYLEFLGLMSEAKLVLTDSGGIQEETTALGVPCLTLRENTERPVTVTLGTNRLVGKDARELWWSVESILNNTWPRGTRPPLWDGKAAERIVGVIEQWASNRGRLAQAKSA